MDRNLLAKCWNMVALMKALLGAISCNSIWRKFPDAQPTVWVSAFACFISIVQSAICIIWYWGLHDDFPELHTCSISLDMWEKEEDELHITSSITAQWYPKAPVQIYPLWYQLFVRLKMKRYGYYDCNQKSKLEVLTFCCSVYVLFLIYPTEILQEVVSKFMKVSQM